MQFVQYNGHKMVVVLLLLFVIKETYSICLVVFFSKSEDKILTFNVFISCMLDVMQQLALYSCYYDTFCQGLKLNGCYCYEHLIVHNRYFADNFDGGSWLFSFFSASK